MRRRAFLLAPLLLPALAVSLLVLMEAQKRCSGWSSIAKFFGTDMGLKNSQMALELMGQAGLRHDRGAEKFLRDSKLLQIYEGTNQLNRLNLFNCLIARCVPQARVFEE